MRLGSAIIAACLVGFLAACEGRPYPPRSSLGAGSPVPDPGAAADQSAAVPQPEAPAESDVFLAARQVAKRGPTRDLRNAAFRYMNLKFSSGTLGSGSTQGLSAPVKVTEQAKLDALEQLLEAVRGLPEGQRGGSAGCVRPYDACTSTVREAWDAPHCSGPLLICLAEQFEAAGESG